jgi:hypothetical protein
LGQALEAHAGFRLGREELSVFEAHQLAVVLAEGMLGFQMPMSWPSSASSTLGSRSSPPKKNSTGSASSSIAAPWASASCQVSETTQGL